MLQKIRESIAGGEFSWWSVGQEVMEFKEHANVTKVKFPSTYDRNVDVEVVVIEAETAASDMPVIIFIHGGGMALGTAYAYEAFEYAAVFKVKVISVEYRLAPEHPFPAGLNDVYDSLKWTIANAESLRIDPEKIVLAGTSGGALLAAAASHRARDEKLHPPIKTRYLAIPALLYPGGHTASFKEFMFIPGLGARMVMWFWQAYVSHPLGCNTSECSPLLDNSFGSLPHTILHTAVADVLRDEGLLYADKLREAGVSVQQCMTPTSHIGAIKLHTAERQQCLEYLRQALTE